MADAFLNAVVETMQDLYDEKDSARTLLIQVGYPRPRIPAFVRSDIFWTQITGDLRNGILVDGLRRVLSAAAAQHPGNGHLSELLRLAGGPIGDRAGGGPRAMVLALLSNPVRLSTTRTDREAHLLDELRRTHGLRVEIRNAVRVDDVVGALRDASPTILHFGGHGLEDGGLVLEAAGGGRPARVSLEALSGAIAATAGTLDAVVLNSCFTGRRAEAFRGVTRQVVGSVAALKVEVALDFARGFYGAISRGQAVEAAFAQGRAEVALPGGDPDGLRLVTFPAGTGAVA